MGVAVIRLCAASGAIRVLATLQNRDGRTNPVAYFNVIIGFFDESGTSQVNTSRFYGLKGDTEKFRGQNPAAGAAGTWHQGKILRSRHS